MDYNTRTVAKVKVDIYDGDKCDQHRKYWEICTDGDIYDGDKCDQHRKYWEICTDGDMQSETMTEPLDFNLEHYPPGTKITVDVPQCPECCMDADECDCGFDWHTWTENKYS